MEIQSGYKTVTPIQLANLLWALHEQRIDYRSVRVWCACLVLVAVREAASRSRRKRGERAREFSRYRINELERLTEMKAMKVRRALRQLQRCELMTFTEGEVTFRSEALPGSEELQATLAGKRSPRRPIPVPRPVLRFLAQNRSETLGKVLMAYVLRGLSLDRKSGAVSAKGTVKASWIVKNFGVSARAVKYAQAELRAMDWITKDTQSYQRKLNRDGAYFVINLSWTFKRDASAGEASEIVHRNNQVMNFAPPQPKIAPVFAPPIEDKKTSDERKKYPETPNELRSAGVFDKGRETAPVPPPNLDAIQDEDLKHFARLEQIYFQAVEQGWISGSEADSLNFIAAAVRAREVGKQPTRLFVTLVRRKLWPHITQAQEDYARRTLNRFRDDDPDRFRFSSSFQTEVEEKGDRKAA